MERIKKALDLAQQERDAARTEPTKEPAPPGGAVPAPKEKAANEGEGIKYTKTRIVMPSEESLRKNRIFTALDDPSAVTAYKILRTQVEQRLSANGWNALAVTSAGADHGKTLTAINLAIALAREAHKTVLLVDLDLRNPSIHRRFDCEADAGIVDYLLDDTPLAAMLFNPNIERLVVLPAGKATPNSSELLSSPKMAALVEELKSRYPSRIILFDMPPLLSTDDMLAFSPYVDAALLVVEDGTTTKDELIRALELLGDTTLLGTVLNKSEQIQPTYY